MSNRINKIQLLEISEKRLTAMIYIFIAVVLVIVFRLFFLMVLEHKFYSALASDAHEIYAKLFPVRGNIFIQDTRSGEEYPVAINKDVFLLFADTREIKTDEQAEEIAIKLAEIFNYNDEQKLALYFKLNKRTDPYEPIENKVEQKIKDEIENLSLPGLHFARRTIRFYPEHNLAAQVIGFLGKDKQGNDRGQYGIEGFWQNELAGKTGFLKAVRAGGGGLQPLAGLFEQTSENGADIVLTIDRALEYKACQILAEEVKHYEAESGTLIIMQPQTGAILTMCDVPNFDLNNYSKVSSIEIYNNKSIFTPYEPGSVFKPLIMAAAINEGVLKPDSLFNDTGIWDENICPKPIRNADNAIYGLQTMTGVLENSINTGMVYVAQQLGKKKEVEYIEKYGFGLGTGIRLDTEVSGTIDTLYLSSDNKLDCYGATASFGQGITATPLQLITAFNALANNGQIMQPYIVDKIKYTDGRIEITKPQMIKQVLSSNTSQLISGMLVSVIDNGQAKKAKIPGYYIAGKTGTGQIASKQGGYGEETNHTFIGYGPIDKPKFIMLVKFSKPKLKYSSLTAAPTFAKIGKFILQYYLVPPER